MGAWSHVLEQRIMVAGACGRGDFSLHGRQETEWIRPRLQQLNFLHGSPSLYSLPAEEQALGAGEKSINSD